MLDEILMSLDIESDKEDNLSTNSKVKNPISKITEHHTKGSSITYILLSPWHTNKSLFSGIKNKIKKLGFSYVQYDFTPDVLTPDIESTKKSFKKMQREIGVDMRDWIEKYDTEHFVIIGISLSCVIASMISGLNNKIRGIILVVPGNSLSESLWKGIRTKRFKEKLKEEGVGLADLRNYWSEMDLKKYIHNFKDKRVKILISKSDKVVPYHLGKKFADEVRETVPDADIQINTFLGHFGTVINFCYITRDITF